MGLHAEKWRDIPGYEGLYQVSDRGRVYSYGHRISPRVMKLYLRPRDGYVCVGLTGSTKRRTEKVHRLVAMAFIPNPENLPEVDHRYGDRSNNKVGNLRWATTLTNAINRHTALGVLGIVGVAYSFSKRNPYRAYIRVNGIKKMLGVFATVEEAANARRAAVREYY